MFGFFLKNILNSFKILAENLGLFLRAALPFYIISVLSDLMFKTPYFCLSSSRAGISGYECSSNGYFIIASWIVIYFCLSGFIYSFIRALYLKDYSSMMLKFSIKQVLLFLILIFFTSFLFSSPPAVMKLVERAQEPDLQKIWYLELPIYLGLLFLACAPFIIARFLMLIPEIILADKFSIKRVWRLLSVDYSSFFISFLMFICILLVIFMFSLNVGNNLWMALLGSLGIKFLSFLVISLLFIYLSEVYLKLLMGNTANANQNQNI